MPRCAPNEVMKLEIPNGVSMRYAKNTVTLFKDKDKLDVFNGIMEFRLHDIFLGSSVYYHDCEKVTFEGYGKCVECTP